MRRHAARLPLGAITKQGTEWSTKRDADMQAALVKFNAELTQLGCPVALDADFFDLGNELGLCLSWDDRGDKNNLRKDVNV